MQQLLHVFYYDLEIPTIALLFDRLVFKPNLDAIAEGQDDVLVEDRKTNRISQSVSVWAGAREGGPFEPLCMWFAARWIPHFPNHAPRQLFVMPSSQTISRQVQTVEPPHRSL